MADTSAFNTCFSCVFNAWRLAFYQERTGDLISKLSLHLTREDGCSLLTVHCCKLLVRFFVVTEMVQVNFWRSPKMYERRRHPTTTTTKAKFEGKVGCQKGIQGFLTFLERFFSSSCQIYLKALSRCKGQCQFISRQRQWRLSQVYSFVFSFETLSEKHGKSRVISISLLLVGFFHK